MAEFVAAVPSLAVSDERRAVAFYEQVLGFRIGVEQLFAGCKEHDVVHPHAPLRRTPWGTHEFGVLDPDGNLATLYERDRAGGE